MLQGQRLLLCDRVLRREQNVPVDRFIERVGQVERGRVTRRIDERSLGTGSDQIVDAVGVAVTHRQMQRRLTPPIGPIHRGRLVRGVASVEHCQKGFQRERLLATDSHVQRSEKKGMAQCLRIRLLKLKPNNVT